MWQIGQSKNGWLVETGPCKSKKEAKDYSYSLRAGIKWKVAQAPDGKWWLLIKE